MNHQTKRHGYTIVEILVVIGVIGILTAILVPLLGLYAPKTRLRGDSKILMSALRKAQQWSITGERRYGIDFYPTQNEYKIFRKDYDPISGTTIVVVLETVDLSSDIEISAIAYDGTAQTGNPRIQFDSFGAPRDDSDDHTQATITLSNQDQDQLTVEVVKNTGHVKIN
jgi:prepilin-type N-terminal cleavage/methylation domain-containing protein